MKRDYDLIRKLLFFFEEREAREGTKIAPIDGYDDTAIRYHLVLLHDAGLLRGDIVKSRGTPGLVAVVASDLTWDGHEFLDKIRNDTTWAKIRATIAAKGGSWAFSVVSKVATRYALEAIGNALD